MVVTEKLEKLQSTPLSVSPLCSNTEFIDLQQSNPSLNTGFRGISASLTWLMALRSHNKYAGLMVSSFPSMVMFFLVCLFSSWKSLGLFNFRSATLASEYNCNYKITRGLHVEKLSLKGETPLNSESDL